MRAAQEHDASEHERKQRERLAEIERHWRTASEREKEAYLDAYPGSPQTAKKELAKARRMSAEGLPVAMPSSYGQSVAALHRQTAGP